MINNIGVDRMAKVKVNAGSVFERREKKFMVAPGKLSALLEALAPYMEQDRYGLHTICTIYYDTEDFAIIRHSLDKPKFKEKLRLRSYGTPGEMDTVYLELKKKLDGITYKRRMSLSLWRSRDYLDYGIKPTEGTGQIFGEIDWFVGQHNPAAKALICYDRVALFGKNDPELRITFDANIRWRDHNLDLGKGDYGSLLTGPGIRLMEVKTLGALPLWLCDILSELQIYPQSFSKYGTVYTEHLMNNRKEIYRHAG